jgi:hypothetical protein
MLGFAVSRDKFGKDNELGLHLKSKLEVKN